MIQSILCEIELLILSELYWNFLDSHNRTNNVYAKKIHNYHLFLRQCHWRHCEHRKAQLIVPPMALLLCLLLVVGPGLKWLALCISVPTTCSRPNIEMVPFIYVCISSCSLPWLHRLIFFAHISYVRLLELSSVYFGILFFI